MKKKIPKFLNEEEAALFWENHEVLDYIDENEFKVVDPKRSGRFHFVNPKKKPVKQLISLRVDSRVLQKAKKIAATKKVGYQTIIRLWLEKVALT